MSATTDNSRVGQLVAGKYRLIRLLGQGGMGAVYEAENTFTRGRIALKQLSTGHAGDREVVRRFIQEARAAATLHHPSVVRVFDLGEDDDGSLYMVQELLEGETLRARLARERRLTVEATLDIARPLMSALEAAHGQGIVHRDIKPENVVLCAGALGMDEPKLIDFGISKVRLLRDDDETTQTETDLQTRTGVMLGTPLYMSPEQLAGESDVDGRTDIWSLAVMLYEMLAGRPPFTSAHLLELAAQIQAGAADRLESVTKTVPPRIADAIHGALLPDRTRRWDSVSSFASALLGGWPNRPAHGKAREDVPRSAAVALAPTLASAADEPTSEPAACGEATTAAAGPPAPSDRSR